MPVAAGPLVDRSLSTSAVRAVGESGDRQAGRDDVAVTAQPFGEDAGLTCDDRVLLAVSADGAEPGAASDLLAFLDRFGASEDPLGRGHDDAEVQRVLALAVLR